VIRSLAMLIVVAACNKTPANAPAADMPAPAAPTTEAAVAEVPPAADAEAPPEREGHAPHIATPPSSDGRCGGIAGFRCEEGLACLDDLTDTCVPGAGGADCIGVCVACDQPRVTSRQQMGDSPEYCARVKFRCPPGKTTYNDACGCGCR